MNWIFEEKKNPKNLRKFFLKNCFCVLIFVLLIFVSWPLFPVLTLKGVESLSTACVSPGESFFYLFTFLAQFTLWPAAFYPWLSPVPHGIVFKFENLNLMKDLCGLSDGPFVIDFGGSHDPLNPLNERPLLMRLASCILASLIIQGRGELLLVPLAALSFPAN